jgi:glycosyltransferase involved in cell wall biosynthesis
MQTALMTGSGIVGNSQATLDDLERFAVAEKLGMPPTVAAWLGIDELPTVLPGNPPTRPTFVMLGTIEARKNHMLLLNIWSRLVERLGDKAPRLLIIGQRGWEADEVFRRLDDDPTLRGHVLELSRCSDLELAQHLHEARALLFPSFAEGYGLPLIEALAADVPVIAANLPVFEELCGSIPLYLDPHDEVAWEAAIIDFARDGSASRSAQLVRAKGFSAPTWLDHFSTVRKWLAELA